MPQPAIPIRTTAEISIGISLAVFLGFVTKLVQLPYGGSINLSILPILILAMRHGLKLGTLAGGLYGTVAFILNPYVFHPIQVIVDYPLAFGLLGFAGSVIERPGKDRVLRIRIAFGIVLGNVLRLAAHFISGWVFFAEYAPEGQPVWLYSLSYNASYVIPETIACMILVQFILRFVQRK